MNEAFVEHVVQVRNCFCHSTLRSLATTIAFVGFQEGKLQRNDSKRLRFDCAGFVGSLRNDAATQRKVLVAAVAVAVAADSDADEAAVVDDAVAAFAAVEAVAVVVVVQLASGQCFHSKDRCSYLAATCPCQRLLVRRKSDHSPFRLCDVQTSAPMNELERRFQSFYE